MGHGSEPFGWWVSPRLFGGVGWALRMMIYIYTYIEQDLGQYQYHEYRFLQSWRFTNNKSSDLNEACLGTVYCLKGCMCIMILWGVNFSLVGTGSVLCSISILCL